MPLRCCLFCNATYSTKGRWRFCCDDHRLAWNRVKARDRVRIRNNWWPQQAICQLCRQEFTKGHSLQRFCCEEHRNFHKRLKHRDKQGTPEYLAHRRDLAKLRPKRDRRAYNKEYYARPSTKQRLALWFQNYLEKDGVREMRREAARKRALQERERYYNQHGHYPGQPHTKTCQGCKLPFQTFWGTLCSHCLILRRREQQRIKYLQTRTVLHCIACTQEIPPFTNNKKFCSKDCREKYQEEHRITIKALEEFVDGAKAHRSTKYNPNFPEEERQRLRQRDRDNPQRNRDRTKRKQLRRQMLYQEAKRIGLVD